MDTLNDFLSVIYVVAQPTLIKIVSAIVLTFAFFFGNLYHDAVFAVVMLMVFDTVLGIWATITEGKPITSRRFSRVLIKGTVYLVSISAGYFVDLTVPGNAVQATMIAFVSVTEFISILENAGRLGMEVPKKLLNHLRHFQSEK